MLFGQYIKQLRESRHLTLTAAAEKLNMPRQKLWDMENGLRYAKKVPRHVIDSLASVYRIPAGVLLDATAVKVAEQKVLSEHLADTRPIIDKAIHNAGVLVNESRSYAPELERRAIRLYNLLSDLKTRVENAYSSLYPNTQDKGPNA